MIFFTLRIINRDIAHNYNDYKIITHTSYYYNLKIYFEVFGKSFIFLVNVKSYK